MFLLIFIASFSFVTAVAILLGGTTNPCSNLLPFLVDFPAILRKKQGTPGLTCLEAHFWRCDFLENMEKLKKYSILALLQQPHDGRVRASLLHHRFAAPGNPRPCWVRSSLSA